MCMFVLGWCVSLRKLLCQGYFLECKSNFYNKENLYERLKWFLLSSPIFKKNDRKCIFEELPVCETPIRQDPESMRKYYNLTFPFYASESPSRVYKGFL